MSTVFFKSVSLTRPMIYVNETQWWLRGFAKAADRVQHSYYQRALAWSEEREFVKATLAESSQKQRNDILHILAASFWGQERAAAKEQQRLQELEEAYQEWTNGTGQYVPFNYY